MWISRWTGCEEESGSSRESRRARENNNRDNICRTRNRHKDKWAIREDRRIACNSSIADAKPEGIRASDRKKRPKWTARKRDDIQSRTTRSRDSTVQGLV